MTADITGFGPDYHVGDEAMAEVAIGRLGAAVGKDRLHMLCAEPSGIRATYGIGASAMRSCTFERDKLRRRRRPLGWLKEQAELRYWMARSDLVFVCGGGNMTSEWPDVLETRLRLVELAHRMNRKVVFASQTLGPFNDVHRELVSDLLDKAAFVGVRDPGFSQSQFQVKCHFAVDDAVFLPAQHSTETRRLASELRNFVGLSLRKRGSNAAVLREISRAVAAQASLQSARTVFFPHHAPGGDGDIGLARQHAEAWSADAPLVVLEPIPKASAMKAMTAHCHWVVSMRYHQLIFSLGTGVPAVGVYVDEYSHAKLEGAFLQFGLEPMVVAIDRAAEELPSIVERAVRRRDDFQKAAKRVREQALEDNLKPYRVAVGDLLDRVQPAATN